MKQFDFFKQRIFEGYLKVLSFKKIVSQLQL